MSTTLNPLLIPGSVLQVVTASLSSQLSTTVAMPTQTVWTQSHGVQLLTASITPKSATSILLVDAYFHILRPGESYVYIGLFRDSGVVISQAETYDNSYVSSISSLMHSVVAGSISPTTFKIRGGSHNASLTTHFGINQGAPAVPASFLRIMEISA